MNSETKSSASLNYSSVQNELSLVLDRYFKSNPTESINSLSRLCSVSEATLRRIYKKKLKSVPTTSTILDLLSVISNENSVPVLIQSYPGVLGEYLKSALPDANFLDITYSTKLNDEFEDSTKYLIYKLSSNNSGVTKHKISQLFGEQGLLILDELIQIGLIKPENDHRFKSTNLHFQSNQKSFIRNFKAVSNFIKTSGFNKANGLNSVKVNYSESVTEKTFKEIVKIQKKANEKIRDLLVKSGPEGDIPIFVLAAIDTLDIDPIDVWCDKKNALKRKTINFKLQHDFQQNNKK